VSNNPSGGKRHDPEVEPPLPAHIARFRERFANDARYAPARAWLQQVSGGWGLDFDIREVARLADPSTEEQERATLAAQICKRLAQYWEPRGEERTAIKKAVEGGAARDDVMLQAVQAGMALALSRGHEPTHMRLGRRWLKDEAGARRVVRPDTDVAWFHYMSWLRQRTLTEARRWLRSEYGNPESQLSAVVDSRTVEAAPAPGSDESGAAAPSTKVLELLEVCRQVASPQARAIVDALLNNGVDLDEAASSLGITRNQLGVQLRRVGKKVLKERPDLLIREG